MNLSEPQVELMLIKTADRNQKAEMKDRFDFWLYKKNDYYCIDGFPTENMPCVIVLPTPMRQGYVYQGLKPSVIVFNEDNL